MNREMEHERDRGHGGTVVERFAAWWRSAGDRSPGRNNQMSRYEGDHAMRDDEYGRRTGDWRTGEHDRRSGGRDEETRWRDDAMRGRAASDRWGDDFGRGSTQSAWRGEYQRDEGQFRRSGGPSGDYGSERYRGGETGRRERGFGETGRNWQDEQRRGMGGSGPWSSDDRAGGADQGRWGTGMGWGTGEARYGGSSESSGGRYTGRGPRTYQRPDERIREEVCETLTASGEVDATDIDVRVANGVVTLGGMVEDRRQKRLAEECAEEVVGVRDVTNQIQVDASRSQSGGQGNSPVYGGSSTPGQAGASSSGSGSSGSESSSAASTSPSSRSGTGSSSGRPSGSGSGSPS